MIDPQQKQSRKQFKRCDIDQRFKCTKAVNCFFCFKLERIFKHFRQVKLDE